MRSLSPTGTVGNERSLAPSVRMRRRSGASAGHRDRGRVSASAAVRASASVPASAAGPGRVRAGSSRFSLSLENDVRPQCVPSRRGATFDSEHEREEGKEEIEFQVKWFLAPAGGGDEAVEEADGPRAAAIEEVARVAFCPSPGIRFRMPG